MVHLKKPIIKDNDLNTDYHDYLWNTKFAQLMLFREHKGHCDVPYNGRYRSLSRWCTKQRIYKKYEPLRLTEYRIKQLNSIGFCWSIPDKMFEKKYRQLKSFYEKHGHCNVTKKQNKVLFKWCTKLRQERKNKVKRLTHERIQKLDIIKFEWELIDSKWMRKYNALKRYVKTKEYSFNSGGRKDYKQLASYVYNLRKTKKAGRLSKNKIDMLNKIGFIWNADDYSWEKHFEELKKYKMLFGHCNLTKGKRDKKYKALAEWVGELRKKYKEQDPVLTNERIKKLTSLGFKWESQYKVGEQNRIPDKDLLNELKRLQHLLKRTPGIKDIDKHGKYSSVTYYLHFGNICNARLKAGLKPIILK